MSTAHDLDLLSEYTHTLNALPLDLSHNFGDLRELDAVLSTSMATITAKITALTAMIEDGAVPKEERLWLLTEIAEEATRLKINGEDKLRVVCIAADSLKGHTAHLTALLGHIAGFDSLTLSRKTTYPHVAARSFMPAASLETGRKRRGNLGSLLLNAPDPSPAAKRKRTTRDEDLESHQSRSPRKEKVMEANSRSRNGARTKKPERATSPAESLLSVTSHIPPNHANSRQRVASSTRAPNGNGVASNKRSRSSVNRNPTPPISLDNHLNNPAHDYHGSHHTNGNSSRREIFNAPPTSSSSHPSLPLPYSASSASQSAYDLPLISHTHPSLANGVSDWASVPPPHTLEGPGMPVARPQATHPSISITSVSATINGSGGGTDGAPTEAGEGDGDGDDTKTYCFCERVSYGEMIACDEPTCDREWFHLTCIGLTIPPDGRWFCETCRAKRNAKRAGRGGKRRPAGNRTGAKAKADHD